ncbi:hypothetical protein A7U60_g7905 [Sanghuangporus baumii]|uniref:Uncharacterized protein n=1 Tax=Sanghuangporus baumii TaxID=108892 RepID=A0A9Q5HS66_SANBA|nr:hypothetical protein A7U60_g7905 [Sanghuangporus baumii]
MRIRTSKAETFKPSARARTSSSSSSNPDPGPDPDPDPDPDPYTTSHNKTDINPYPRKEKEKKYRISAHLPVPPAWTNRGNSIHWLPSSSSRMIVTPSPQKALPLTEAVKIACYLGEYHISHPLRQDEKSSMISSSRKSIYNPTDISYDITYDEFIHANLTTSRFSLCLCICKVLCWTNAWTTVELILVLSTPYRAKFALTREDIMAYSLRLLRKIFPLDWACFESECIQTGRTMRDCDIPNLTCETFYILRPLIRHKLINLEVPIVHTSTHLVIQLNDSLKFSNPNSSSPALVLASRGATM